MPHGIALTCIFWGVFPAPEISISPVPDIVFGSRHYVPVTRNLCRSSVYDILLKLFNGFHLEIFQKFIPYT